MKIIKDPEKRWEQGMDHHPDSIELYKYIAKLDLKYGDVFGWKSGGDGDNGENLMYLMDSYFEERDINFGRHLCISCSWRSREQGINPPDDCVDCRKGYEYDLNRRREKCKNIK